MGSLPSNQGQQGIAIGHVDHMAPVSHLLRGRPLIPVYSNDLNPITLKTDRDLLTKLPTAKQHDAGRSRCQGCTDIHSVRIL